MKQNNIVLKHEETVELVVQNRRKSFTWWIGMADAVITAVLGVLMAAGAINAEVGGAIISGSAVIFAYCNNNNPSLRDVH